MGIELLISIFLHCYECSCVEDCSCAVHVDEFIPLGHTCSCGLIALVNTLKP